MTKEEFEIFVNSTENGEDLPELSIPGLELDLDDIKYV